MLKQMAWLPTLGSNGTKILHLRIAAHETWRPYNTLPQFAVPDYPIPGGSKGWATYQKLRSEGWTLIPSDQARMNTFSRISA
ncbi:hypothetical protein K9N68_24200 [Kovacikia minuta CCNUW1]|uniref:hypothetical protein n=1 Tax=Kovacikia minuta TaxID=2931930 RepID=UPI001CCA9704|nr:hypothetical protein [Kovacikia minuta]UBF24746.1 hypothetical protein K9N68_24200 [Kovacikia minuta CCNUW1]